MDKEKKVTEDKTKATEEVKEDPSFGEVEQTFEELGGGEEPTVEVIEDAAPEAPIPGQDMPSVEEEGSAESLSIREQQTREREEAQKDDTCPVCFAHASSGVLQPRIGVPAPDGQVMVIALPLLVCFNCTNVFMPKSFLSQLAQAAGEQSKIITP